MIINFLVFIKKFFMRAIVWYDLDNVTHYLFTIEFDKIEIVPNHSYIIIYILYKESRSIKMQVAFSH